MTAAQYLQQILDKEARGSACIRYSSHAAIAQNAIGMSNRDLLQVERLKSRPDWHLLEQVARSLTDALHSRRQSLQTEAALLPPAVASLGERAATQAPAPPPYIRHAMTACTRSCGRPATHLSCMMRLLRLNCR